MIIADAIEKDNQYLLGIAPNPVTEEFHAMQVTHCLLIWLQECGILEQECFMYRDYPLTTWFALDSKSLEPYRDEMLASGVEDVELGIARLMAEDHPMCHYSGATAVVTYMGTYRSNGGCVGRSCEIPLLHSLDMDGVQAVADEWRKNGTKAAVLLADSMFKWD